MNKRERLESEGDAADPTEWRILDLEEEIEVLRSRVERLRVESKFNYDASEQYRKENKALRLAIRDFWTYIDGAPILEYWGIQR